MTKGKGGGILEEEEDKGCPEQGGGVLATEEVQVVVVVVFVFEDVQVEVEVAVAVDVDVYEQGVTVGPGLHAPEQGIGGGILVERESSIINVSSCVIPEEMMGSEAGGVEGTTGGVEGGILIVPGRDEKIGVCVRGPSARMVTGSITPLTED